jgi:sugar lactone lactonase YvrE
LVLGFVPGAARTAEEWVPLFDGSTLDGWTQRGGNAVYEVVDATIRGTAVPGTPNSFLCTDRDYGDFVLELEFKVDPRLNSGVQIRSRSLPDYKKGQVHGYQVEIDPSDRGWSGGIYDEGRRGWLDPLSDTPAARYAFRQGDWNHYRVEAIGDSIRTWINGVAAADLVDSLTLRGFIALQVHGVGKDESRPTVQWRNIRIQDLGESTWRPLFNGKDLAGWKPTGGGVWTVADGILRGVSPASEPRHGLLWADEAPANFTARVRYRAKAGNSGFYFRAEETDHAVGVKGFQAEIDASGAHAGGLYETLGRAWVVRPDAKEIAAVFRPGDWNEMTVSAQGTRLAVHVNGSRTADLQDPAGRLDGRIALQLHGGQDMDVEVSAVELLVPGGNRPVTVKRPPDPVGFIAPEGASFRPLGTGFKFTEGPAKGPDGRIWFSDIPNERIHVYDPADGSITVWRENSGRANGLWWTPAGALLACEGGARRVTRQFGDVIEPVAETFDGKRFNSPNDLVLDGHGGFYFTDPRYGPNEDRELERESVYYRGAKGQISLASAAPTKPNGVILSPDEKTLYVADTAEKKIWAFDVPAPGALANPRLFVPSGSDGMAIDVAGNVYLTAGPAVTVWSPAGEHLATLPCPEAPANCTFGGPENKTLFVTARTGFYAIDLNVPGLR